MSARVIDIDEAVKMLEPVLQARNPTADPRSQTRTTPERRLSARW